MPEVHECNKNSEDITEITDSEGLLASTDFDKNRYLNKHSCGWKIMTDRKVIYYPVKTRLSSMVGSMMFQRLRRWVNIESTLVTILVSVF